MKTISIPEVGDIDFPDEMSDDDISAAIRRDIIPRIPRSNPDTRITDPGMLKMIEHSLSGLPGEDRPVYGSVEGRQPTAEEAARPSFDAGYQQPVRNLLNPPKPGLAEFPSMKDVPAGMPGGPNGQRVSVPPNPQFQGQPTPVAPQLASERERTLNQYAQDLPLSSEEFNVAAAKGAAGATPGIPEPQLSPREEATGGQYLGGMIPGVAAMATGAGIPAAMAAYGMEESLKRGGLDPNTSAPVHPIEMAVQGAIGGILGTKAGQSLPGIIAGFGGLGAVQSAVAEVAREKRTTGEVSLEQANNPEFLKSLAVSLIQGLMMGPMAMGHGGERAPDPLETVSRPGENSDYQAPPEPGRQPITPAMADAHAALPEAPVRPPEAPPAQTEPTIPSPQPEPIVPRERGIYEAAPTPDDMQGRQWAAGTEAQTRLREAEAAREPIAQAHDDAVQAAVEAENALRSRFPEDGVSPKYPAERDLQRALTAKHQEAEAALADARSRLDEANAARDEAQQAAQRAQPSALPDIPMDRLKGRQEAIRAMQEAGLPPEHIQRATEVMDRRPEVYELGSKAVDLSPEVLRQLGVGPDVSRETPALHHEGPAPKISYETVDFGEGSPLQAKFPEFQAMPYEQKAEASKQLSTLTRRIASQVLGVTGRESEGPGFWEDYPIRPNAQLDASAPYEKAAAYADLVGYLHQQDAVFMMREHPDGQKLGVKLAFEGGRPDEAKLSRFWGELRKAAPDLAIGGMSTPEGIIIARDEPSSQREAFKARYSEAIRSALERSGLRAEADFANIDWELRQSGGWKDGNNGRAYLERLQQALGPGIGERVDRLYRPAVESAVGRIVAGKQPEPVAAERGALLQEHDAAHGRGERDESGELQRRYGIDPAGLEANTPEAAKSVYTALGNKIEDRNTGPELKIYPLADVPPEKLQAWLQDSGWNYKIFGPDQETGKFVPPNFREFSYDNKHVWIFSPWTEHGSFRDTEYTRIWRVTHEVAHGQTNDQLTQRYGGVGRRQGALGRATKFNGRDVPALSLADALRAVEWEHDTFQRQREILEKDFGIKITEEAFRKENAINMIDAVYRVLTGDFSNPGDNGLVPRAMPPDQLLARAKDILRAQAKDLGIDTAETFSGGARLQDQSQGEIKGAFIPSTAEKNGMVYLVKGKADFSTVMHEYLGHGLEEALRKSDPDLIEEASALMEKSIGPEARGKGNSWTVEGKEWFARKVEQYFYEGNTDVPSLKPLFEKIRAYMQKVYAAVVGGPMGKGITADERAFFDKVFGKGEKPLMQKAKAPSEEGAPQAAARGETKKAEPTPESRPTLSAREGESFGSKPVSVRAEDKSATPKRQVPGERSLPKTLEAAGVEGGTDRGYEVKHLDESAKAAMAEIDAKGAEVVQHDILGRPKFDPQDMPRAIALMRRWQHEADSLPPGEAKDTALAKTVQMASEMSRRATEAGQFNAMVRILEKLSPDGVVYYAQKQLDKLNVKRGPKREVKLKPEVAKALREAAKELKASQDLAEDAAPLAKAAEKIEKGQALNASDLQDLAEFRRRLASHLGERPPERPKGVLRGATSKPTAPAAKGPKPTLEAAEALLAKREEAALARLRARGLSPTKALLQSTRTLTEEDVSDLADVFASRLAARKASVSAVRQNFTESFGSDITPFLDDIAQKGARRLQEARRERARMTDLSRRVDEILAPLLKGAPAEINQAEQLRATFDAVKDLTGDAKREASWDLQETLNAMVPAGAGKQAAAVLAIAQLLNPKTALRNIVGNELFHAAERASKWVAANGIDWPRSVLTGTDRTLTFRTGGQGDYWKSLMTGTEAALRGVNPEGLESKYDLSGSSFQSRKNPFYWAERALGVTMRATDYAAYKRAYGETMGELAEMAADRRKVQGSQRETFINKWIDDAGPEVREIAEAYGKYATFQDATALAKGAAGLKNFLNAGKDFGMGNFIINYPKTPANILMRAIEYSPAGILRSVGMLWKGWRTGIPVDVRELEMSLGRVLVGGMGGGLAWYLAKNGALTGQAEKDKDARAFEKEQAGESNYQVNVSAIGRWLASGLKKDQLNKRDGDKLISYDWAQPLAINAAMTATAVQALSDKRKPIEGAMSTAEAGLEGATKTLEEQPLLSGLERLFNSDKSIPGRLMDILEGVPASFSPTLLNQIRQMKDNTARSADAPTAAGRMINKVMYRLPFLSEKLPIIYKTLGKSEPRETYQNGNNNLFNVFLNPAFVAKYHVDPGIAVILSPYEKEGRKNQFPQALTKRDLKYSQHGEQKVYSMSGDELSELQRRLAQETYRRFESMHIERLKDASPERQEKILAHGVNDSWNKVRKEFLHEKGIHAK